MARAQRRDAEPDDGYIPFLERFRRWWRRARTSISGDRTTSAIKDAKGNPEAITCSSPEDVGMRWTDGRVAFCRRLWAISDEGNEMVEPGGAACANTLLIRESSR